MDSNESFEENEENDEYDDDEFEEPDDKEIVEEEESEDEDDSDYVESESESSDSDSDGEDDTEENEDSETSSSEDGSSQSSSDERLEVKVMVYGTDEVRGFSDKQRKILKVIRKSFIKIYNDSPQLSFRDADGDIINIKAYHDLKYAKQKSEGTTLKILAKFSATTSIEAAMSRVRVISKEKENAGVPKLLPPPVYDSKRASAESPSKCVGFESTFSPPRPGSAPTAREKPNSTSFIQSGSFLWQKGALIGAGSFGSVYRGTDMSNGNRVAVKEVDVRNYQGKRQREHLKLLQREVTILSNLQHSNIIVYYGSEYSNGLLRIFLELADQGSIKDTLDEFGALSEPLLRRYINDTVRGLQYLHEKRIIHRDVKPSNLLLDRGVVKLADFGCSTYQIMGETEGSSNGHNTMTGTTIYMSPEVMAEKKYGRKSDVWSLGITLVEMAQGKPPFRTAAAAIYSICVSREVPSLPTHLSQESHEFLSNCLVYDTKARATCDDLIQTDFICTVLTSQQSIEMTKSTKLNHVASSVSMNPLSEMRSPETKRPVCKDENVVIGEKDDSHGKDDHALELEEEIKTSESAFLSRRFSAEDGRDRSFLIAAGQTSGYTDSSFDDSMYLHPSNKSTRSTRSRVDSRYSNEGKYDDETYEDDEDDAIQWTPSPVKSP